MIDNKTEEEKRVDIIVPFKNEYLKELPFGQFKTRHGVAIVLSYLDDSENVTPLMQ